MTTFADLAALMPEAAVEPTRSGEVVIYTGLRLDPRNPSGPLIPFECPVCSGEDPEDNEHDCQHPWHIGGDDALSRLSRPWAVK